MNTTELLEKLRSGQATPDLMARTADLIDALIGQCHEVQRMREADLSAWRRQTQALRDMVGRSGEDIGPRRIVADLLAQMRGSEA